MTSYQNPISTDLALVRIAAVAHCAFLWDQINAEPTNTTPASWPGTEAASEMTQEAEDLLAAIDAVERLIHGIEGT